MLDLLVPFYCVPYSKLTALCSTREQGITIIIAFAICLLVSTVHESVGVDWWCGIQFITAQTHSLIRSVDSFLSTVFQSFAAPSGVQVQHDSKKIERLVSFGMRVLDSLQLYMKFGLSGICYYNRMIV